VTELVVLCKMLNSKQPDKCFFSTKFRIKNILLLLTVMIIVPVIRQTTECNRKLYRFFSLHGVLFPGFF
jgi:hypothetical protein